MTPEEGQPYRFTFITPGRSEEYIDFEARDIGLRFRRSRGGRMVMMFPAPYEQLELVEGTRLGPAKWARIQAALADLKQKGQ